MAPAKLRIGSLSGVQLFDGRIAAVTCKAALIATAPMWAAFHAGAQVEFKLPAP